MKFDDIKQQISSLSEGEQKLYRPILSLASLGGSVLKEFQPCLDQAGSYRDFFECVYRSDDLKFTKAWGAYAKAVNKNWIERFTPARALRSYAFDGCGLVVGFEKGTVVVPLKGHGKIANIVVFGDGQFNKDAALYFSTFSGRFTCCDFSFDGTFDVFTSANNLILEEWALNERGQRIRAADLAIKYRKAA